MTIKINCDELVIRPSSVDSFFQCSYQWGKTFLEGKTTIPNSRAAIGTAIHAGVERMWRESIEKNKTIANTSMMVDAAVESWKEETNGGVSFDDGENENTCIVEIVKGTEAFVEDIVPFTPLPVAVEERYTVNITDHPLVTALSGTVDYITENTIADVKTSKKKASVANYKTQQSIYKYLAVANGVNVEHNLIQNVVLKKQPDGAIYDMPVDVDQAKHLVNTMLDTLAFIAEDKAPIEMILRGNPKYYLCSPKYCTEYNTCPFVKGRLE